MLWDIISRESRDDSVMLSVGDFNPLVLSSWSYHSRPVPKQLNKHRKEIQALLAHLFLRITSVTIQTRILGVPTRTLAEIQVGPQNLVFWSETISPMLNELGWMDRGSSQSSWSVEILWHYHLSTSSWTSRSTIENRLCNNVLPSWYWNYSPDSHH